MNNTLTTYEQFGEVLSAFANGHFGFLCIVGTPGLSKGQSIRQAMEDKPHLLLRGRMSGLSFFTNCFEHQDEPIIIDDADSFLADKLNKEYVKLLTETDEYKQLKWETKTKVLCREGVPPMFHTTSKVCILTNNELKDEALLSRAHLYTFQPTWAEMYKQVSTWFWDQEIFDYVWSRLDSLKEPDCRIFIKAEETKVAGLKTVPWKKIIDAHCDDDIGQVIRRLMKEPHKTNTERARLFTEETGADRATFYRRLAKINLYSSPEKPKRILLKRPKPKPGTRPEDGFIDDER